MKKMKIYFYGEIYNIRNSYDIYKKETKSGEEKIYELQQHKTKKYENLYKKIKKNTKSYHMIISYHIVSLSYMIRV